MSKTKNQKLKMLNEDTGEVEILHLPFKTQYNAKAFPDPGEKNNLPSETIPDQSMSISEILRRFAQGLPIDGARVSEYDEGEDILEGVNWQTLDLAEKAVFVDNVKAELAYLQKNYDQEQKRKKQAAAIEYQEKKKAKEAAENTPTPQSEEGNK